ncbi:peptide deformylase [Patescibacteria group bacterium]|nr:MAG: peptide deformylase [Patescibacteria group bacterium]
MPRLLKIVTHPNPILRTKAADISPAELSEPKFKKFLDDLTLTMYRADGIGLAAIQVGRPINVAVVSTENGPFFLINSAIVSLGEKKELNPEGCLSVPGISGEVSRAIEIKVKGLALDGKAIEFSARDLFARVIQHEVDHLNGILFIDRAARTWKEDKSKKTK